MSTSTTAAKNVQRTTKTREPSKDRLKAKKDDAPTRTKTLAKAKSTDVTTPSSNRTRSDAAGRLSNRQPAKRDESITSTTSSRIKRDAVAKTKTLSSTRKDVEKTIKTPTSTRLKSEKIPTSTRLKSEKIPTSTRLKSEKIPTSTRLKSEKTPSSTRTKPLAEKSSVKSSSEGKGDAGKSPSSTRLKVSSRKPGSPNGRIKKTQYIPNKKEMMSNALKSVSKENSFIEEPVSLDSSAASTSERPRTATLRKGSIVNKNIAGPDVPKPKKKPGLVKNEVSNESKVRIDEEVSEIKEIGSGDNFENVSRKGQETPESKESLLSNLKLKEGIDNILRSKTPEDEYDYEEDFDSYASDFDEYQSTSGTSDYSLNSSEDAEISTSSSTTDDDDAATKPRINSAEEERKLDSGNFDLPETKHKQILGNISEKTETTNGSLSDEGFEEIKSLQFVNFAGAKKRRDVERSQSMRNRRGEELLGMIRLDQRNFTLLDIPAVSYDTYIKSFGNRNSMQVSSQTHEDDISEETQTEVIASANKWTQFPIKYPKLADTNELIVMNYEGVGGDTIDKTQEQIPKFNEYNLARFLRSSAQVVLALLEENEGLHLHNKDLSTNVNPHEDRDELTEEVPTSDKSFCDSGVLLFTDFLKPRRVSAVSFSTGGLLKLVTVHPPQPNGDETIEGFALKTIGCVWDPSDFSVPEDLFAGYGSVNCACFAAANNKVIFGGLKDGTVTLWDLLEADGGYLEVDLRDSRRRVRLTNTAKCTAEPDLGTGCAQIVAVSPVLENSENTSEFDANATNNLQVLSLNEIGDIIVWGLITHVTHKGATLVKYSVFSLGTANPELIDLHCTDMCLDQTDPNHIYVATNYGYTLHCLVTGSKASQKKYSPVSTSRANAIEPCYHRKDCFLVGYENGNVSLYTKTTENPLRTYHDRNGDEYPVRMVQWSRNKPWIFYTADSERTVHVWDLTFSEHFPSFSVPLENGVKMMRLSEPTNINNKRSYMAIISKNDKIHLHQLTGDHSRMSSDDYSKDLKVFTNYVNRL